VTWTTVALGLGGALGALARRSVQRTLNHAGGLPLGTLVVNLAGAFALGFLLTVVARRWSAPMWAQEAVFVGFLGGFTTFSAFSAETLLMVQSRLWASALAYAGASVVGSVLAILGGMALGRWLT
jgi:CrcB protein